MSPAVLRADSQIRYVDLCISMYVLSGSGNYRRSGRFYLISFIPSSQEKERGKSREGLDEFGLWYAVHAVMSGMFICYFSLDQVDALSPARSLEA